MVPVASIGSTTITREPSGNLSGNLWNEGKELQNLQQSLVAKRHKNKPSSNKRRNGETMCTYCMRASHISYRNLVPRDTIVSNSQASTKVLTCSSIQRAEVFLHFCLLLNLRMKRRIKIMRRWKKHKKNKVQDYMWNLD